MDNFKGFPGVDEVRRIIHAERGNANTPDEVEEYVEGHQGGLTNEELEELLESCIEEEDEEETEAEPAM